MSRRFQIAAALAAGLVSTAAQAQVVGDQLIANPSLSAYTVTAGSGYLVPDNWACTNYPRLNRRCSYRDSRIGLLSSKPGSTPTSLQASPVNPTWWQSVNVPVAGLYDLRVVANKLQVNTTVTEVANQAIVIKAGTTELLSIADSAMSPGPVGVHGPSVTLNKLVRLNAGTNTLSFGLRYSANNNYYSGYTFFVDDITARYVSP